MSTFVVNTVFEIGDEVYFKNDYDATCYIVTGFQFKPQGYMMYVVEFKDETHRAYQEELTREVPEIDDSGDLVL